MYAMLPPARPHHSSVIVGLSFHPSVYDTFPGAFSWSRDPKSALKQAIGIFGGLSAQNLMTTTLAGFANRARATAHGRSELLPARTDLRAGSLVASFILERKRVLL